MTGAAVPQQHLDDHLLAVGNDLVAKLGRQRAVTRSASAMVAEPITRSPA
jgi:hypothetical protein